ncbi:hypothetical protein GF314_01575 [bacterium]|nr:hypothetical protein [bacterium]
MKSRATLTALSALMTLASLAVLTGCENHDGNDWQRLVCDVQSVNAGAPLVSAYLDAGSDRTAGTEDDYQPIDTVQVVFHARPYGSTVTLPEDGAHSWFQIDRYDLIWETDPGTPVDLSPHNVIGGHVDIMVPVHEEAAGAILVAGSDMKNAPWFVDVYTGNIAPFQADAKITFYGHETGSSHEVAVQAGCRVHFIAVRIQN